LGLYGTKSCKVYDDLCSFTNKENKYFCDFAKEICEGFPDDNFSQCVRQCLQEKAIGRICKNEKNDNVTNAVDHKDCWVGCGINPENPYDYDGPDLPDRDLRLPPDWLKKPKKE